MTRKVGTCEHPKLVDWWGYPLYLNEYHPRKINVFKTVEIALALKYKAMCRNRLLYSVHVFDGERHVKVDAVVINSKVYRDRTYCGSISYYLRTGCDSDAIDVIEDNNYVTTFRPNKYIQVGNNLVRSNNAV